MVLSRFEMFPVSRQAGELSQTKPSSASSPVVARARLWGAAGEGRASFPSWAAGVHGRTGSSADVTFHIALWTPNFLYEARTLCSGRHEGKQLLAPAVLSQGFPPPCQRFHCCGLHLLLLSCCSPRNPHPQPALHQRSQWELGMPRFLAGGKQVSDTGDFFF